MNIMELSVSESNGNSLSILTDSELDGEFGSFLSYIGGGLAVLGGIASAAESTFEAVPSWVGAAGQWVGVVGGIIAMF